jgi:hypothetical protein
LCFFNINSLQSLGISTSIISFMHKKRQSPEDFVYSLKYPQELIPVDIFCGVRTSQSASWRLSPGLGLQSRISGAKCGLSRHPMEISAQNLEFQNLVFQKTGHLSPINERQ